MIRCAKETADLFREIAEAEGRKQGKMLEILCQEYAMKRLLESQKNEEK